MKKRRHENQYSQSDFRGLYLGIAMTTLSYLIYDFYTPVVPFNPFVAHSYGVAQVQASEPVLETYNAPKYIVDLIVKYFGDEAQNALKVVGTCENKGWNTKATNQNRNGSWDAGIFQINSVHGYSQQYLFNPENNIKAAKKIFDGRGWSSWSCSHVLQIKSFWQ